MDSAKNSQQAVAQLKEMQDEVRGYWESYQNRFVEVDESLGKLWKALIKAMQRLLSQPLLI
ncbi:hypothetical protein O9929_17045 [Vibrio lentus]|nr:hypothetical protein [Vibrio lentus]